MKKLFLILLSALAFSGCDHNDVNEKMAATKDHLPLQVGNYWDFQSFGNSQTGTQVHREVAALTTINDHEYYLLINSAVNGEYSYKDSSYYRIDDQGFVYIYRKNTGTLEDNRFRLNGKDGDAWSYPYQDNGEAHVNLSVSSLTIGNKEVANCKSYYFDIPSWADEEYTITLAPGIGFVKEYSNAWGLGQTLQAAKIDGQVFTF
jgi:hypothetical protein